LAQLLAKATAGASMEPGTGGDTKGPNRAMDVLGALGMSGASAWGAMILLASYQDDDQAMGYVLNRATRFAWQTWLRTAQDSHTVTTKQIRLLAKMAVAHHMNPAGARRHNVLKRAKFLGVNHQTFQRKFRPHYQRLMAELQYQEEEAARKLLKRL